MRRRAVIALGNPLRGDDGVGVRILQALEERSLPPDVSLIDGGTGGMKILHLLKDVDDVVFIDAVSFGGEPGEYVFFTPDQVTARAQATGMHDSNLFEVLQLSEELDERPRGVVIMGIQPRVTGMGEGLSMELEARLDEMVDALIHKLRDG